MSLPGINIFSKSITIRLIMILRNIFNIFNTIKFFIFQVLKILKTSFRIIVKCVFKNIKNASYNHCRVFQKYFLDQKYFLKLYYK